MRACATVLAGFLFCLSNVRGDDQRLPNVAWKAAVHDSLSHLTDAEADAQAALDGLQWPAADFTISSQPLDPTKDEADAILRFPSPLPCGIEQCDTATLHWYAAKDKDGHILNVPAVVVVHESGSRQTIGRLFARAFRDKGIHAFMLSLPNYGSRRTKDVPSTAEALLVRMKQGIADARRAKDVVAAIPGIDTSRIGLLGISLGGFVSATAGSLDGCYHNVFVMLAGGDIADIILHGGDVAAIIRQRLSAAGITEDQIRELASAVEPLRVAHRLNPETTWLYTATSDQIISNHNAALLAEAAHLPKTRHVQMAANHYTGVIYYPMILNSMIEQLKK